jgi:hypothetical protein
MEPQIATTAFLSAFADDVQHQRDAINRQWMLLVRESPAGPDAMHISQEALQDHVPELIDDLVARLRSEKLEARGVVADHSRSHGREQWKAGYNISELIWEIDIIKGLLADARRYEHDLEGQDGFDKRHLPTKLGENPEHSDAGLTHGGGAYVLLSKRCSVARSAYDQISYPCRR